MSKHEWILLSRIMQRCKKEPCNHGKPFIVLIDDFRHHQNIFIGCLISDNIQ